MARRGANGFRHKIQSKPNDSSGFSLIELMLTATIIVAIVAMAVPNLIQAMRAYQLTAAAHSVSDLIQRARYEAIKRNTKITCYFSLASTPASAWVDVNSTGTLAANDPQVSYPAEISPTGGSLPSTTSMGFPAVTRVSNSGSIAFDSRGAVDYTGVVGGPTVWVLYFTRAGDSSYGAKAVSVEPLGRSKLWSAPASVSTWQSQ